MKQAQDHGTRPGKKRPEKRQAILAAARQAFREYGVQATSMDRLAALAEVSKRTVYNHFRSKEVLVAELLSQMWLQDMQELSVVYDPQLPLRQQLIAVVLEELDLICAPDYLDLVRVALGHHFYNPDALQQEMDKIMAQETSLERWVRAALDDGRLKDLDVDFASHQLYSLIKGSGFWPQLLGMAAPLDAAARQQLAEQSVDMFLAYYQS